MNSDPQAAEVPQILLAVTGASGAIYARRVLARLLAREARVGLTISEQGLRIAREELGEADDPVRAVLGRADERVLYYPHERFDGPFATGSAGWRAVVIVPCSMGAAGRIAAGVSTDLITRAADVALKERRRLVLAVRETPLNLIHLRNLTTLAEAGAIIASLAPGFYQHPQSIDDLVDFMAERIVGLVEA